MHQLKCFTEWHNSVLEPVGSKFLYKKTKHRRTHTHICTHSNRKSVGVWEQLHGVASDPASSWCSEHHLSSLFFFSPTIYSFPTHLFLIFLCCRHFLDRNIYLVANRQHHHATIFMMSLIRKLNPRFNLHRWQKLVGCGKHTENSLRMLQCKDCVCVCVLFLPSFLRMVTHQHIATWKPKRYSILSCTEL